MDERSTISWMIMGGPRYDEHSQAELDHLRALRERHAIWQRVRSGNLLARLAAALDPSKAKPAGSLTVDFCSTYGC